MRAEGVLLVYLAVSVPICLAVPSSMYWAGWCLMMGPITCMFFYETLAGLHT